MKKLFVSFAQFVRQITKDLMLFAVIFVPILFGSLIHFGIPIAEGFLTNYFNKQEILLPHYLLFDLTLAIMTPMMYCYVSAMIILGEIDDKISNYMAVTPLGKNGYLISRLGIPSIISIMVTVIILSVFALSKISILMIITVSILTALFGLIISMLIVSLSTNKVEGMAVTKISGILILGIVAPFFIKSDIQYILFFMPSFWIAKYAIDENYFYVIFCMIVSIVWVKFLMKRYLKKLT